MSLLSCLLLVDDDDITNYLNQALIRRLAITDTILVAQNGQEALDLLAAHCPEPSAPTCPALVLLDMKMPVMNGLQFLEAYRQQALPPNPNVIIIMLTTSLNPGDVAQMQSLPIAGYLTKPLTKEKVHQVLREHFGIHAV